MKRFSVLLCSLALLVWAPAAQAAPTVVDLRNDAVTSFIASFGAPNTATYGQLVTAPPGAAQITNFGFRVEGIPANAIFNGEIYAWDGEKATGPALYESPIRETTGTELQDVTFETGGTPVVPGAQYVLFMSISKNFEGNPAAFAGKFRTLTKEESEAIYPAGKFVFINNGTDEGKWTTEKWSSIQLDLQFTARFISQQPLTVTKSGNGSGTVTSNIGGINCGAICSAAFLEDTVVTLTASASPGSTFLGFSGGGCLASPCQVPINNAQAVSAVFADTTPPKATITKHTKKKIAFKSSEPGSTFKCKLDKGKFRPCKSPFKLKRLKAGRHHFSVVATDPVGNVSKPAKLKFSSE